jgi:hypothetical protein
MNIKYVFINPTIYRLIKLKLRGLWPWSANELYRQSDRRQRGGSLRPYSRLYRQEPLLFLFQVAPQLYSRDLVDPVPDPIFFRKSGSAWNRTLTSVSVARNSDHKTREAVYFLLHNIHKFSSYLTGSTITTPFCSLELWALDHRDGQLVKHMNKCNFNRLRMDIGSVAEADITEYLEILRCNESVTLKQLLRFGRARYWWIIDRSDWCLLRETLVRYLTPDYTGIQRDGLVWVHTIKL